MVYLLKHSSIFLPLPHKKHHQVAGPPINDICRKLSNQTANSHCRIPSLVPFGNQYLNIILHTPLFTGFFYLMLYLSFARTPKEEEES